MNEANDQRIAAQIQQLREKAEQSELLEVELNSFEIDVFYTVPGEGGSSNKITIESQHREFLYEPLMTTVGEILAQNHVQLHRFRLFEIDSLDSDYPQFWRGLAANQVLKDVCFERVTIPNGPAAARFLANPALESVEVTECRFPDGIFDSFCQAIRSSRIKKLKIVFHFHSEGDSWSLLWSALEHGATCLESLDVGVSIVAPLGAENGFESCLANNTTIQRLHLNGFNVGDNAIPLLVALGRGLAVNTTVKILHLDFNSQHSNPTVDQQLIQTVFTEGLDHNMAVESLTVTVAASPGTVNALVDGLERMMRNRANAATLDGHDQEGPMPVLKDLVIDCTNYTYEDDSGFGAIRDELFDRLSQSDVILVENIKFDLQGWVPSLSSKVYDFIRSTQVTKSLELITYRNRPLDDEFFDLADAMEANNSISELKVEHTQFHKTTNLLSSPNKYRIRCQCRRNKLKIQSLQTDKNMSLLPLVLARLLSSDGRSADDEERSEIEARLSVGRTFVFEILKDIPALFGVCGKRKRED